MYCQRKLKLHRNGSARLKNYNYGQNGAYFITICTKNKKHYFGDIVDGKMRYSNIGKNVCKYWEQIPNHFPFVILDEWIVMPNHFHGIVVIEKNDVIVGTPNLNIVGTPNLGVPTNIFNLNNINGTPNLGVPTWEPGNLCVIINHFKRICTIQNRKIDHNFVWQPRFYDHIIRNKNALQNIRNYIKNNPTKWNSDRNNQ